MLNPFLLVLAGVQEPATLAPPPARTVARDLAEARARVRDGRDTGTLTRGEARAARREIRRTEASAERYGKDGLSAPETRELEIRAAAVRSIVDAQRSAAPRR